MSDDPSYIPRLYGRRQDKTLTSRADTVMRELLPVLQVGGVPNFVDGFLAGDLGPHPRETQTPAQIDLQKLIPGSKEYWLEVGFGGGEHLAWQAAQNPNIGMIGAEPFVNGVAKLLTHIDDMALKNIRVHFGDARPLMSALPDGSLSKLFVLHPDPWPKARHHKRRMISPWFLAEAARLLKPGAILRVASDIEDYVNWTLMHVQQNPDFEWLANSAADWHERPDAWPQTRYEAKSLREGRRPAYLQFRRR